MNWFKHYTNIHNDPDIVDSFEMFSHLGYTVFCVLHEIYGFSFNDVDNKYYLKISLTNVRKKVHTSERKLLEILNFFLDRQRIDYYIKDRFIIFKLPEFIKLANRWTIANQNKLFNNSPVGGHIEEGSKNKECRKKKNNDVSHDNTVEKPAAPERKHCEFEKTASDILKYLNAGAGKNFSDTRFIVSLLQEGKQFFDFITIINNKLNDPFFQKNRKLLNPRTLFNREKFDIYKNENDYSHDIDFNESFSKDKSIKYDNALLQAYISHLCNDLSENQDYLKKILSGKIKDFIEQNNAFFWVSDLFCVSLSTDTIVLFHPSSLWNFPELLSELCKSCKRYVIITHKIDPEFVKSYSHNLND